MPMRVTAQNVQTPRVECRTMYAAHHRHRNTVTCTTGGECYHGAP
jgi:hypothetical protein